MHLDEEACLRALRAHDARFDGLFFVAVSSTGIYCRPICTARQPKRENITFFASAAEAEHAGYRPCRLCRPELAPGRSPLESKRRIAAAVVRRVDSGESLKGMAEELGITDRHLRRAVRQELGVTPVELVQTHRLLTAKALLTDTRLPLFHVAAASGFSSVRRFNALFSERYRLSPSALRKHAASLPAGEVRCQIGFRPPYDWDRLIRFLSARAIPGVESIDRSAYARVVRVAGKLGWVSVSPSQRRSALLVRMSESLAPVMPKVLRRVRRLFDTDADPQALLAVLGPMAESAPGLRIPGAFDAFEMAIRAILGQQVSVRAASTMAARIAQTYGDRTETPFPTLEIAFPSPERISQLTQADLAVLGITTAKSRAILALATQIASGDLRLESATDPECTMAKLAEFPGIGEWTAAYLAMRALGYPDAFPHGDLGIRRALGETNSQRILEFAERWRPWRAYAAIHLWNSLEERK